MLFGLYLNTHAGIHWVDYFLQFPIDNYITLVITSYNSLSTTTLHAHVKRLGARTHNNLEASLM